MARDHPVPLGNPVSCCELGFCCGIGSVAGTISGVVLSLLYRLVRCLFGLLAVLVRSDLSKDIELLELRHENQVLRRQLSGRLRRDHAYRLWLAALSGLVSRRRSDQRSASPTADARVVTLRLPTSTANGSSESQSRAA